MKQIGSITRYLVVAVEHGNPDDGNGICVAMFKTMDEAEAYMDRNAMQYASGGMDGFLCRDSARVGDEGRGCEWRIEKLDIPVFDGEIETGVK